MVKAVAIFCLIGALCFFHVAQANDSSEQFVISGGHTTTISPDGIVLTMLGSPFQGQGDVVGISIEGKEQALRVGDRVDVPYSGGACSVFLASIFRGENRGEFIVRCTASAVAEPSSSEFASLSGVSIKYYVKWRDRGAVERALREAGLAFETEQSSSSVDLKTNMITCSSDVSGEAVRRLALLLFDAGVKLYAIEDNRLISNKSNRITIQNCYFTCLRPIHYEDLTNLNSCPLPYDPVYSCERC